MAGVAGSAVGTRSDDPSDESSDEEPFARADGSSGERPSAPAPEPSGDGVSPPVGGAGNGFVAPVVVVVVAGGASVRSTPKVAVPAASALLPTQVASIFSVSPIG